MIKVCTLAAFVGCHPEVPVVVAANRDEFFARPTAGPILLESPRALWAGVDLRAGGTWLGANEYGLIAAVLNRRSQSPPDPSRRSRGTLVADVLQCRTTAEAVARIEGFAPTTFNLFTLLVADPEAAVLLANEPDHWRSRELGRGLHVVTNRESESLECPRHERTVQLLSPVVPLLNGRDLDRAVTKIWQALGDHGHGSAASKDPLSVPCVHTADYGTRSSSVLILERSARRIRFLHAEDAPCRRPLQELPPLLLRLDR